MKKIIIDTNYRKRVFLWLRSGGVLEWTKGLIYRELIKGVNRISSNRSSRVSCPICGWVGASFLPLVTPFVYRKNEICPRCGSFNRYRALVHWLQNHGDTRAGQWYLDIAPLPAMRKYVTHVASGRYVSIDYGLLPADARMDVRCLGLRSDFFDWIFCFHVLEFVPEWKGALKELSRVLRPGGKLILTENYGYGEQITIPISQPSSWLPQQRFGEDLPEYMEQIGLHVDKYDYLGRNNAQGDWFFICTK